MVRSRRVARPPWDPPFPVQWRTDLDSWTVRLHAPILLEDGVIARCGDLLTRVSAEDGTPVWETRIKGSGGGSFFFGHEGLVVTEVNREPDRLSSVVALDGHGQQLWRLDLDLLVTPTGAAMVEDALWLASHTFGEQVLIQVEPRTGAVVSRRTLNWYVTELMAFEEGFLARYEQPRDTPALFKMRSDGTGLEALGDDQGRGVWAFHRAGNLLVTASRETGASPGLLRVRDVRTMRERWSAPVPSSVSCVAGDCVIHVEGTQEQQVIVARDFESGRERWRTEPLSREAARLLPSGPVVYGWVMPGVLVLRAADGVVVAKSRGSCGPAIIDGTREYTSWRDAVICTNVADLGA
ncbi:MAG: PQQ-binding-like beta-propeller repeat protein [Deltaproteobacteria bacterium]|nr:PQQ-binding-like beta-propeller repeat protein [Deltaproteobacteria bacterium]